MLLVGAPTLLVIAIVVIVVVVLTGNESSSTVQMRGIIEVAGNGGGYGSTGQPCETNNDGVNADIAVGSQIVVKSNSGKTVGVGQINAGTSIRNPDGAPTNDCDYEFAVHDLPSSPFYNVGIPGHGSVTVSKANSRKVYLTIGE